MAPTSKARLLQRLRVWLVLFIIGLVVSGITAFPLERETAALNSIFRVAPSPLTAVPYN